ncbi:MAG: DUF2273 domain-containing protein [Clostridia bacterium]
MDKDWLLNFYRSNKGGIIGAAVGLVFAFFIMFAGFFWAIFIAICTGIGYYVGKRLSDDKEYVKNLLDRILPPGTYR